jgi:hypothetical protein
LRERRRRLRRTSQSALPIRRIAPIDAPTPMPAAVPGPRPCGTDGSDGDEAVGVAVAVVVDVAVAEVAGNWVVEKIWPAR